METVESLETNLGHNGYHTPVSSWKPEYPRILSARTSENTTPKAIRIISPMTKHVSANAPGVQVSGGESPRFSA